MNFDLMGLFTIPTKVFFGYHSINVAGPEAKKLGIKKVLIVIDVGLKNAKVHDSLIKNLEGAGLPYEIFEDVPMDPGTEKVDQGVHMAKKSGCNGVIGLGGGSVLCAAKGIALVAANGGNIRDYEGQEKYKVRPWPNLAIPTTAGSGSEVSQVFIISDETRNHYKMTIGGYHCFPDVAILDPLLLRSLPPKQFVISGLDALSHAYEATCTNQASPLTDCMAYEAIRLIMKNIGAAAYTDNLEAKRDQLIASSMANIACGNAKLGLVHAMGQPLSSYNIPHGTTIGVLLPYVMEFNLPACLEQTARIATAIGVAQPGMTLTEMAEAALDAVIELYDQLDFPDRLTEEMAPQKDIPEMVKIAMGRPMVKFSLRKAQPADLTEIYKRVYHGWR
jgi:alcohol dehydrogenase class IV